MRLALQIAAEHRRRARPNPTVGCVIVAGGEVVGRGASEVAGERHAEIVALEQAGDRAAKGVLYVTLEPCAHAGRTPPCVDRLISAGLQQVVYSIDDPNPAVNGAGAQALRAAGIEVSNGLLAHEASRLHRGFLSRMRRRRPWLCAKMAMSLDGATAMASGESQWITAEAARDAGHQLRSEVSAIITGVGTVLADDPRMTARLARVDEQPLRVIIDSSLRSPPSAKVFDSGPTRIYTALERDAPEHRARDAELVVCAGKDGQVDLTHVLRDLGDKEHNHVLLEAGARLTGAFVAAGLVDEYRLFLAPLFLGSETKGVLQTPAWSRLADGAKLQITDIRSVGDDWMISALADTE